MALSERHRWCISKILETFRPDLTTELAQSFMRNENNLQKFNSLFKGEGCGRLFVFFQNDSSDGDVSVEIFFYCNFFC